MGRAALRRTCGELVNALQVWRRLPTVASLQARGGDHFMLLRLLAAVTVIYSHAYAVKLDPGVADAIGRLGWGEGIYAGALAVKAFFCISGYLVCGSWFRQRGVWRFLQARAVRILPAYWVLLLLTVTVLGPWCSSYSPSQYYAQHETWAYLWGNAIYHHRWTLPGVFEANPLPGVVNGSLWSLQPEVLAYLALAGAGAVGILRRAWVFVACIPLVLAVVLWLPRAGFDPMYVGVLFQFGLGCTVWMARRWLPLHWSVLVLLVLLGVLSFATPAFTWVFHISFGYAVLWVAYLPAPRREWLPGDYSYGLYLWAFPVQQWVALQWPSVHIGPNVWISTAISGILAVLSWHLIERPTLQRWRPARPSHSALV